jgi:hypothetical protein
MDAAVFVIRPFGPVDNRPQAASLPYILIMNSVKWARGMREWPGMVLSRCNQRLECRSQKSENSLHSQLSWRQERPSGW